MLKQKNTRESNLFSAVKKIDTVVIHYNAKLDTTFVNLLEEYILRVAKKLKANLKNPNGEEDNIHVYIYPSVKEFNRIFGESIVRAHEKNNYLFSKKTGIEEMYIVRDDDSNIHMASPRGMSTEKIDTLTKVLVVKIMNEYIDEQQSIRLKTVTREVLRAKSQEEKKKKEKEELEEEPEEDPEEEQEEEIEEEPEKIDEEELNDMIGTEEEIEEIIADEEKELPLWIILGWKGYVKGKLKKESDIKKFSQYVNRKGFMKASKVTKIQEDEFAIVQIAYLIDTYKFVMLRKIIQDPDSIYQLLNTTKYKFEREVKSYAYSKYSLSEMKLDRDQKSNTGKSIDITKIEITSPSSYEIKETNELIKNEKIKQ